MLAETPQILKEVLEFIASEDPHHFEEMKALIKEQDDKEEVPEAAVLATAARAVAKGK